MSDELIKSQNNRISELEKRVAQAEVSRKEARRERDAARAELQAKAAELDDLLSQADEAFKGHDSEKAELAAKIEEYEARSKAAPDEKDAKIRELEGTLRSRDVKDKFRDVEGELADGLTLDDLFTLNKFDMASADPASLDPAELVTAWRTAKPGTFKPAAATGSVAASQGGQKPPLKVAETPGRGARDSATGRVSYSKADLRKPGWETFNPSLYAAMNDGTAVCNDAE